MDRTRHTTRHLGVRYRLSTEGRRYIVGWVDPNGVYRTETLPLGSKLADAVELRALRMGAPVSSTSLTVTQLMDKYLDTRQSSLSPKTREDYRYGRSVVHDFMGNKKVKSVTPNDIAALTASLAAEGKKGATIRKILTPLNGAMNVAVREGWIPFNPADKLLPHERPKADAKEMRCLSPTDIRMLLGHASSDRWKALFALLAFTGLRVSEALALTWDDITPDRVKVRASKTDAGVREVMLIPRVHMMITKIRLAQPAGTRLVFATSTGTPVARRSALVALRAAEKSAGLPEYTLHELRHTFASMLISQGESIALVADQMGHADPGVTLKTYAHLFDAQKNVDAARERLSATLSSTGTEA